jgi:hypothetical protein
MLEGRRTSVDVMDSPRDCAACGGRRLTIFEKRRYPCNDVKSLIYLFAASGCNGWYLIAIAEHIYLNRIGSLDKLGICLYNDGVRFHYLRLNLNLS